MGSMLWLVTFNGEVWLTKQVNQRWLLVGVDTTITLHDSKLLTIDDVLVDLYKSNPVEVSATPLTSARIAGFPSESLHWLSSSASRMREALESL